MQGITKGESGGHTTGCWASLCGVRVMILRGWGQVTAGVGASYCGGRGILLRDEGHP